MVAVKAVVVNVLLVVLVVDLVALRLVVAVTLHARMIALNRNVVSATMTAATVTIGPVARTIGIRSPLGMTEIVTREWRMEPTERIGRNLLFLVTMIWILLMTRSPITHHPSSNYSFIDGHTSRLGVSAR
jgi:prepilin-type processing-associated H-X9-DG protein